MLIDFDLDVLKFIMNPNYDIIREKMDYIKQAYIMEYGKKHQKKITQNFNKINYLVIAEKETLKKFISEFEENMVIQLYKKLLLSFGFQYPIYIDANKKLNFIEKIFIDHNILFFENDKDLVFFRGAIKNQLVSLLEDSQNKEERAFLKEQLNFIKDSTRKYDVIKSIFQAKKKEIRESDLQVKKEKSNLKKQFIQTHPIFLTNKEEDYLKMHPDYDVEEFLRNAKYYQHLISSSDEEFCLGSIKYFRPCYDDDVYALFVRKNILVDFGMDITKLTVSIRDGATLLKEFEFSCGKEDKKVYSGLEAMDMLEEELKCYNEKYHEIENNYRYIIGKDEFVDRYLLSKEVANRSCNRAIKDFLIVASHSKPKRDGIYKFITNSFQKLSCRGVCATYLLDINARGENGTIEYVGAEYMILDILSCVGLSKTHKPYSAIDDVLSHEGGHIASLSDTCCAISGIDLEEKYTNLNELYNQYKNRKVRKILKNYPNTTLVKENSGIESIDISNHTTNYFLLEPFMEKYEEFFENAIMENDINILNEWMGKENLEEYVTTINDFYQKQKEVANSGKNIFIEEFSYVQDVKKKVNQIVAEVEMKNNNKSHASIKR